MHTKLAWIFLCLITFAACSKSKQGSELYWEKSYEFDEKGKVISQTEKTGGSPTTYRDTYDCDR